MAVCLLLAAPRAGDIHTVQPSFCAWALLGTLSGRERTSRLSAAAQPCGHCYNHKILQTSRGYLQNEPLNPAPWAARSA